MAYREYIKQGQYNTQTFRGLQKHERPGDGEWYDMLNLTADEYPVEKTRAKRVHMKARMGDDSIITGVSFGEFDTVELLLNDAENVPDTPFAAEITAGNLHKTYTVTGLTTHLGETTFIIQFSGVPQPTTSGELRSAVYDALPTANKPKCAWAEDVQMMMPGMPVDSAVLDDKLFVATDTGYVISGDKCVYAGSKLRQIVAMGRRIFTNTGFFYDEDLNLLGQARAKVTGTAELKLCNEDGTAITPATTKPTTPANGDYYHDDENHGLYRWSDAQETWVWMPEQYIMLEITDPDTATAMRAFKTGDAVDAAISWTGGGISTSYNVHYADETGTVIIFTGLLDAQQSVTFTIERRMPELDFICEHENRVYGCRFGSNDKGEFVNEIYASALGDPLNWFVFEGTAADSYMASVGAPGAWTGCCEVGEYVMFYKADKVYVLSGGTPASYRLTPLDDFGVQPGSSKSLCVIDNYAYYKSEHGIMRIGPYNFPVCISRALGYDRWTDAVAGTDGRKYYVVMTGADGRSLYVYDTETRYWTRENDTDRGIALMTRYKNNLLAISAERNDIPAGVSIKYDPDYAEFCKPTAGSAWTGIVLTSKIRESYSLLQMYNEMHAEESAASGIDAIVAYYEGKRADKTLYVKVEKQYCTFVDYDYINAERPRDMALITGAFAINNYVMGMIAASSTAAEEPDFDWFGETGPMGLDVPDEKRIRYIQIRAKSAAKAAFRLKASYDEDGTWMTIRDENRAKTGTYRIAWTPARRCGCFRLRLEGTGETVIYSINIITEDGGDYVD